VQDAGGRWVEGPTLDWGKLPARVEGVIEKRIGRLAVELQEALKVASVEGEDFTAQVVAWVQELPERPLLRALSQELEKRHRLVRERGEVQVGGQFLSRYRFAHALFQQYVYHTLSAGERRLLHREIAQVLEGLYGEQAEEIAVQLARHFQAAGIAEKAIDYLYAAGNKAVRLSANEEAIGHLSQGLELLKTLPDTPERARKELALQLTLGVSLQATKGWPAPEVGYAYGRARELSEQVGDTGQLFRVLWGLFQFHVVRGELQASQALGEQHLALAQRVQDSAQLVVGHFMLAGSLSYLGEFSLAREHWEPAIAQYDPRQHGSLAFLLGSDPGVFCLAFASHTWWALGYPDQALAMCHAALALAEELSHPFSQAVALAYLAMLHQFRREPHAACKRAEEAIAVCAEQGFAYYLAWAKIIRGWALAAQRPGPFDPAQDEPVEGQGHGELGMAQMQQGLADLLATGAHFREPYYLSLLAAASGNTGQVEPGLTILAKAQVAMNRNEEWWQEAELHRLKGELLLKLGAEEDEVAACFHRAISVARRQAAKSWELRATVSLCRLWQQQGKREEGRQRLTEIYGGFTEGFDTPDLIEAKALLEELSS
jgi:predicted ATPase